MMVKPPYVVYVKLLLVALFLIAVSVGCAVAHADEFDFVRDMNDAGFENDNGYKSEIAVGMRICEDLLSGSNTNYGEAHKLYLDSKLTSMADAEQFVRIAIKDLCP